MSSLSHCHTPGTVHSWFSRDKFYLAKDGITEKLTTVQYAWKGTVQC